MWKNREYRAAEIETLIFLRNVLLLVVNEHRGVSRWSMKNYVQNLCHFISIWFRQVCLNINLNNGFNKTFFYSNCSTAPSGPRSPHCWGFGITLSFTLCRTPSDESCRSSHSPVHYTKYNTHIRRTSISLEEFEFLIPAFERPQTPCFGPRAYIYVS
jgi:hypothetical protein